MSLMTSVTGLLEQERILAHGQLEQEKISGHGLLVQLMT